MASSATETTSLLAKKEKDIYDAVLSPQDKPRRFSRVPSYHDLVQKRPSTTLAVVFTIVLGVTNNVLLKIMYSAFGDRYAYAASQLINLLYIVLGGIPLLVFMVCTDQISQSERRISKKKFFYMGLLDALGTFLTAFGAIGTPGQLQPALNQTLLPMTMVVSYCCLRKRFSKLQVYGAVMITVGVTVSVVPSIASAHFKVEALRWNSVAVYLLSNLPMAFSTCYKGYTIVNFAFNFCGLFLTKHGSAVLNTIAFTAIIPINTIVFAAPFLGRFREEISLMSILGAVAVILGVFLYQSNTRTARVELRKLSLEELDTIEIETTQSAFQERIIGIDAVAGAMPTQSWVEPIPRVDDTTTTTTTTTVRYDTLS